MRPVRYNVAASLDGLARQALPETRGAFTLDAMTTHASMRRCCCPLWHRQERESGARAWERVGVTRATEG